MKKIEDIKWEDVRNDKLLLYFKLFYQNKNIILRIKKYILLVIVYILSIYISIIIKIQIIKLLTVT